MTFFSLLYKDKLKAAPGQKILPAEAFSVLLDVEALLARVKEEEGAYRREIVEETEKLKRVAEEEGFAAGEAKWAEQIAHLEEQIGQVREEIKRLLVPVVLQSVKKIIGRELELDRSLVADIVLNNLRAVSGHHRIRIFCHRNDLAILEREKPRLIALFDELESFTIEEREGIEELSCVIETDLGIINTQWSNTWEALERALVAILKSEED